MISSEKQDKSSEVYFNSIQLLLSLQQFVNKINKNMSFGNQNASQHNKIHSNTLIKLTKQSSFNFGMPSQKLIDLQNKGQTTPEKQLYTSKKTQSTNFCSQRKRSSLSEEEELNGLDFTFNQDQVKPSTTEHKSKYESQCPYSIILFGLLFNHLHLQGKPNGLPQINRLSKKVVEIFKASFLDLEDQIIQSNPQSNFSALSLMQIMHQNSGSISKRQRQLRQFMATMTPQVCRRIFSHTIRTQREEQGGKPAQTTETVQASSAKNSSSSSLDQSEIEEELKEFSQLLGIRIKVYDLEARRKKSFGAKSSPISLSLKRPSLNLQYSLKTLSCSEGQQ